MHSHYVQLPTLFWMCNGNFWLSQISAKLCCFVYFRSAIDWVAIWGWPLKIPKGDRRCQQNRQDLGSKAYWELHRLSWPIVLLKSQSLFIWKRQFPQGPWLLQQVKKLPSERGLRQKQQTSQLPELNHAPVSDQVRTIQLSVDTNCHLPASRQ